MNKSFITLAIGLLVSQISFSQNNNLLLFGKILNSQGDTIVLSNHYGKYIAITNQNEEYKFDLNLKDPDFLNFELKGSLITLFIVSGDTLEMNFDFMDIDNSIKFKGNRSDLNTRLRSISNGKIAPDFSLKNTNGEMVNLSDFKGKFIYIDVWNSACKPCLNEFQYMDNLIEKYKDKDIVFVSISLDKNEETWKKTIEKKGLKGIQLYGEGWKSEFVDNYSIIFNPRFILLDTHLRFIYPSAPRPSGNIDEILSLLLDN